jgi:hypothetical protein
MSWLNYTLNMKQKILQDSKYCTLLARYTAQQGPSAQHSLGFQLTLEGYLWTDGVRQMDLVLV